MNGQTTSTENGTRQDSGSRYSRGSFLKRVGVSAGAVAAGGGLSGVLAAPAAVAARSSTVATSPTTFGRIFNLPAFAPATDRVRAALLELGKAGGVLDAGDDLGAGPVQLIANPALSAVNRNNPSHTAGTTFFGQFVDHDVTFDTSSTLGVPTDPATSPNGRSPSLDLDSVYGGGPIVSPQLYDPADRAKLKVGFGGLFEDLPRAEDLTAIIGDPRNDENLVISGLHAAFLLFHNRAVDELRGPKGKGDWAEEYAEARRLTSWHYQWLVVNEFLPQIVGQRTVDEVLRSRRFYRPQRGQAFMPVEFQGACYRFGHSMVRPSYRANLKGDTGSPFFAMIFDPAGEGQPDPVDLRGGARASRRFIGWQTFFDFADGEVKPNKRIDTKISTPLFNIPLATIASHDQPQVLPQRNLLRQLTWSLPSGQALAAATGAPRLAAADLAELQPLGVGFESSTPPWYYVLKEAELINDGLRLGPVGGRIVAEVLIGLLEADPNSYRNAKQKWAPTLGSTRNSFKTTDFLHYAGVDPTTRHGAQPDYA